MILLIDNYDSFTYNLYQYMGTIYPDIKVVRNDEITLEEIEALNPAALVISPGPGRPEDAGISIPAIQHFAGKMPILGICLGHQAIAAAFGGEVVRAKQLMHGKSSNIKLETKTVMFRNMETISTCGRYHSLIVDEKALPGCLTITARDENSQIMALEHSEYPIYGLQFHPESILSKSGMQMLINFISLIPNVKIPENLIPKPEVKKALCPYLAKVIEGVTLTEQEAHEAMLIIMGGEATQAQVAAFLAAMRMKVESIEEIAGLAKGMREKAIRVEGCNNAIDIVGTGGDGANTFNVSTTSSFVIAAAGMNVAKHGNRGVSSKSGAADVLERLGAKIQSTAEEAKKSFDTTGLCFLFAQSYHTAMRYVAPVRREIGIRTVFNILGPLTNPAAADYMVLGVYEPSLLPIMAKVLISLGIKRAMVVHGKDRLDEVSISDATLVAEVKDGTFTEYEICPEIFGLPRATKADVVGDTPETNAQILKQVLSGQEQGAKRNIVLLNAGCALYVGGKAASIADGIRLAAETIDSGKALAKMNEWVEASNQI